MKIPYTKLHYSNDELLQAIQQKGYSHEDAEIILQYGHMAPGEQTACICGNTLITGSTIDIEAIHRRAKDNKLALDKHNTIITKAEQYIAVYPMEFKERTLAKEILESIKYYADSPTEKSLTKEEANTLAIRKYIVELKGAQQESRLFATPISCTAEKGPAPPPTIDTGQGVSAGGGDRDVPHEQARDIKALSYWQKIRTFFSDKCEGWTLKVPYLLDLHFTNKK